ncbi:MAG: DMT family transporter [Oscillospiraceae bacterium]|nr:DMT family transporter [Oscillospiraceae bacterium]
MRKHHGLGVAALLVCTMIWGGAFVLMKTALDDIDPYYLLAIRFSMAAVLLLLMGCREWKKLDRHYVLQAIPVGIAVALAYVFQTIGLVYTTPGKNAFLTVVYCVFTPFLYWLFRRIRPDRYNFIAAVLCLVSVGLISLDAELSINLGDALTVVCGFFYALHIIVLDRYAEGRSAILVTALQFTFAALFMWILSLLFGTEPTHISAGRPPSSSAWRLYSARWPLWFSTMSSWSSRLFWALWACLLPLLSVKLSSAF